MAYFLKMFICSLIITSFLACAAKEKPAPPTKIDSNNRGPGTSKPEPIPLYVKDSLNHSLFILARLSSLITHDDKNHSCRSKNISTDRIEITCAKGQGVIRQFINAGSPHKEFHWSEGEFSFKALVSAIDTSVPQHIISKWQISPTNGQFYFESEVVKLNKSEAGYRNIEFVMSMMQIKVGGRVKDIELQKLQMQTNNKERIWSGNFKDTDRIFSFNALESGGLDIDGARYGWACSTPACW